MGFGLLWTALVRRLSAITLFVIFNAAVYPFGRIDLVGHALIMTIIVAIAAQIQLQHGRDVANRKLAEEIISAQRHEIQEMKDRLAAKGIKPPNRSRQRVGQHWCIFTVRSILGRRGIHAPFS